MRQSVLLVVATIVTLGVGTYAVVRYMRARSVAEAEQARAAERETHARAAAAPPDAAGPARPKARFAAADLPVLPLTAGPTVYQTARALWLVSSDGARACVVTKATARCGKVADAVRNIAGPFDPLDGDDGTPDRVAAGVADTRAVFDPWTGATVFAGPVAEGWVFADGSLGLHVLGKGAGQLVRVKEGREAGSVAVPAETEGRCTPRLLGGMWLYRSADKGLTGRRFPGSGERSLDRPLAVDCPRGDAYVDHVADRVQPGVDATSAYYGGEFILLWRDRAGGVRVAFLGDLPPLAPQGQLVVDGAAWGGLDPIRTRAFASSGGFYAVLETDKETRLLRISSDHDDNMAPVSVEELPKP